MNTRLQMLAPFIYGFIHDRLLQSTPHVDQTLLQFGDVMNSRLVHPLLHHRFIFAKVMIKNQVSCFFLRQCIYTSTSTSLTHSHRRTQTYQRRANGSSWLEMCLTPGNDRVFSFLDNSLLRPHRNKVFVLLLVHVSAEQLSVKGVDFFTGSLRSSSLNVPYMTLRYPLLTVLCVHHTSA